MGNAVWTAIPNAEPRWSGAIGIAARWSAGLEQSSFEQVRAEPAYVVLDLGDGTLEAERENGS